MDQSRNEGGQLFQESFFKYLNNEETSKMNKTSTSNFGRMIVRGGVAGVLLEGENDFMDSS